MLLTVVAALMVATAIVLAAHAARDRRALLAELRAVREELRELTARTTSSRPESSVAPVAVSPALVDDPACHLDVEEDLEPAPFDGELQHARGSRTVH